MNNQEALDKFRIWYFEPIEKLKELPNGGGGFVAFMVGLTLYERLIIARIKQERNATSDYKIKDEEIKNACKMI
jgi:hypothetical protein